MYYLDLLRDMTGNKDIIEEMVREYFNMYFSTDPQLNNKEENHGEIIFEVRCAKLLIGGMSELHLSDFNCYFENKLEDDCTITHNKLWIAIVYQKLKELSPAFAEDYMKRAIARNDDMIEYIALRQKQKADVQYSNLVAKATAERSTTYSAIDNYSKTKKEEFNSIFNSDTTEDKTLD